MLIFKKKSLKNEIKNWLLYKKNTIKISTYYRYLYITNKYILPYLKNKNIFYFLNYDFNIYIDSLSKYLSSKTVKDILSVLKSILRYIQRKYNIDYKLDLVSCPKYEKNEIQILNNEERHKLESFCLESQDTKKLGIAICLNTGLRIGEICALTWNDINLEDEYFSINKAIQRIYKGTKHTDIHIDKPKTKNSMRLVPIPTKILKILKSLKNSNNYDGNTFFLTESTKYIEPRIYDRFFKKSLQLCNIRNYNFHSLRHTFATNCINIGMDVKSLSELLGHSDVNITLNTYVHSSYYTQKKYLNKL